MEHVNTTINRAFNTVVAFGLLFVIGLLGYQAGDRALPIDTRERVVLTPNVKPGEDLQIKIRFVTNKICATHSDRFIFDGKDIRYNLDPIDYDAGQGQLGVEEEFTTAIPIPLDAEPGQAKYRVISSFKCNFIQKIWPLVGPVRDIEFVIVPVTAAEIEGMVNKELQDLILKAAPAKPTSGE